MRQSIDATVRVTSFGWRSHDTLVACLAVVMLLFATRLAAGAVSGGPGTVPIPPADTMPAAPGRLVDIGGYRLHLFCTGAGPTVILEAGLGGFSLEWDAVQTALSATHRVCSYDRAGYGWSDPGPAPRTAEHLVQELDALLTAAALDGPFILVGHSFGGYVVQLFAKRFPSRTAAIVLVDSSHPAQFRFFPASQRELVERAGRRQAGWAAGVRLPDNYPPRWRAIAERLAAQRKSLRALAQEYRDFVRSGEQVDAAGRLPDVPAVVLTRGERQWPNNPEGDAMEATWPVLQRELAADLPQAFHFNVTDSGHHIHLDRPSAVDDAVGLVTDRLLCQRPGASPASTPAAGQC